MFSLESPHRGDSNEHTQHTIINIIKRKSLKSILNTIMSAAMRLFGKGLEKEFVKAVVNEPSVLEQLKFYCRQP